MVALEIAAPFLSWAIVNRAGSGSNEGLAERVIAMAFAFVEAADFTEIGSQLAAAEMLGRNVSCNGRATAATSWPADWA